MHIPTMAARKQQKLEPRLGYALRGNTYGRSIVVRLSSETLNSARTLAHLTHSRVWDAASGHVDEYPAIWQQQQQQCRQRRH